MCGQWTGGAADLKPIVVANEYPLHLEKSELAAKNPSLHQVWPLK
jgi:hypothetical protein